MNGLNIVVLQGNITHDPELRYTPKGTAVATLGLAINRAWKDEGGQKKEEVTFVDVQCWGKQAEAMSQHLKKGSRVAVQGRLKLEKWETREGKKAEKLIVVMDTATFMGHPNGKSAPEGKPGAKPGIPATPDNPDDDDVPF